MHSMGAPDLHSVFELERAPLERQRECLQVVENDFRSAANLKGLCRVDHVVRGQTIVEPSRSAGMSSGCHAFGHRRGEGDDVVPNLALDVVNALEVEAGVLAKELC